MTPEVLAPLAGVLLILLTAYVLGRRERARERERGDDPPGPPRDASDREQLTFESDGERVIALLRGCDGPVPQQRIIELTGWSASKVSRVLTELAEENAIVKVPVGRENIIQLTPDPSLSTAAGLADADADADA